VTGRANSGACAYHRTRSVKLARTIADLAGSEEIQYKHSAGQVCLASDFGLFFQF